MIIAIDDVQWLDAPSARVLAFVVRRLEDAPIRILVALRSVPAATGSPWVGRGRCRASTGCPRPAARGGDDPAAAGSKRGGSHASHPAAAPPDLGRKPVVRPRDRPGAHRAGGPAGAWRTPARPGGPASAAGHTARRATVERRRWAPRRGGGGPSDRIAGGCGGRIEPGIDRHHEGRRGGHPAAGRWPDRVHPPPPGVDRLRRRHAAGQKERASPPGGPGRGPRGAGPAPCPRGQRSTPPGGTSVGGGRPARSPGGSPGRRRRATGAGPEADTAGGQRRAPPTERRGGRVPLRRRRRDPRDGVAARGDRHGATRP